MSTRPGIAPVFRILGHAGVALGHASPVVVDPWHGHGAGLDAALALVTHGHADHCSEEDLAEATTPSAPILCPTHLEERLRRTFGGRVVGLAEGRVWTAPGTPGLTVRALPAEGPRRAAGFHPRGDGLAYLVTMEGASFLALGDSDALAEHCGLAPDVAFFAVGDFTVMTPEEAVEAAVRVAPRVAVPVHWGDTSARFAAAARFVSLCTARGIVAEAVADRARIR